MDGEIDGSADRSARDKIAIEILNNAAETQGADFANYTACMFELAQINMIATRLATKDISKEERLRLASMVQILTTHIDSAIFDQIPAEKRIEAAALAKRIIEETRKLPGAT